MALYTACQQLRYYAPLLMMPLFDVDFSAR